MVILWNEHWVFIFLCLGRGTVINWHLKITKVSPSLCCEGFGSLPHLRSLPLPASQPPALGCRSPGCSEEVVTIPLRYAQFRFSFRGKSIMGDPRVPHAVQTSPSSGAYHSGFQPLSQCSYQQRLLARPGGASLRWSCWELTPADTSSYEDPGVILGLGWLGLPGRLRQKKIQWKEHIIFNIWMDFLNIKFTQPEWTCQNREFSLAQIWRFNVSLKIKMFLNEITLLVSYVWTWPLESQNWW